MAIDTYTPGSEKIVHEAKVDFVKRVTPDNVYMVQYDSVIPVIGVKLYSKGSVYVLPNIDEITLKVRWGKKDSGIFVYKDLEGCNVERNTVYLEVDSAMTDKDGMFDIIIEMSFGGTTKAGSSPITMIIEPNPIQNTV